MKKETLLYIPLLLLFAFAMSALGLHYSNIVGRLNLDPKPYRIPFGYFNGAATNLTEKAKDAGIKAGDEVKPINERGFKTAFVERAFKVRRRIIIPTGFCVA